MRRSTCCVIGGGPAGLVLALLLARAGVEVTVFEKHGDFLRDFRGDTVHPTTLSLLDDLGLAEEFERLPQRRVTRIGLPVDSNGGVATLADLGALSTKYNYVAMVPQWDLLDLLATEAAREPTFTLRMNTEVTGLIRENGLVKGVRYRTADGTVGEHRATLTVACDGRDSLVRTLPELGVRDHATPMDVRWFRIPRHRDDPPGILFTLDRGRFFILIDRGDYFQAANLIAKGTDAAERALPIERFEQQLVEALPWLGQRRIVTDWDDVKLLHVRLDRLRKWHLPGLLCIGDAAHAMSPVGGIGINLAIQDAVAAARHLAGPLRTGRLRRRHITAIQRRRWPTTALVQLGQRAMHSAVIEPALHQQGGTDPARLPAPLRVANTLPWLRRVPAYIAAYGAFPERPPREALR